MKSHPTHRMGAGGRPMLLAIACLIGSTAFAQAQTGANREMVFITMTRGEPESDIETAQPIFSDEEGTYFSGRTLAETTLKPEADVSLHNCDYIVITDDFETKPGASLRVFIKPCGESGNPNATKAQRENAKALAVLSDIKAYPNPFEDRVYVHFTATSEAVATVSLRDIIGRNMTAVGMNFHTVKGVNTLTVQGTGLPAGVYLLSLEFDGGLNTVKLIKGR